MAQCQVALKARVGLKTEAGAEVAVRARLREVEVNSVARWFPHKAVNVVTPTFAGHVMARRVQVLVEMFRDDHGC